MTYNITRQHRFEFVDFITQFSNQFHIRIFIDSGFVDDVLGTIGIAQRAQGFTIIAVGRRQSRNHNCLAVATQTIL